MKKYILILLLIATYANAYTFRKTWWGATRKQVIKSEKNLGSERVSELTDADLVYNIAVLEYTDVVVRYVFLNNHLVRAEYSILNGDYWEFRNYIWYLHGEPTVEELSSNVWNGWSGGWFNNWLYFDKPTYWGEIESYTETTPIDESKVKTIAQYKIALANQKTITKSFFSLWYGKKTIVVVLSGMLEDAGDQEFVVTVSYISRWYNNYMKRQKVKQLKKLFR